MKKQLLLMITVLSTSLTIFAQNAVASDVGLQVLYVGRDYATNPNGDGTNAEGFSLLTNYTRGTGAGTDGYGYEQFNADTPSDNTIEFSLQSTENIPDVEFIIEARMRAGSTGTITITYDNGTPVSFSGLTSSSEYYRAVATAFDTYYLPVGSNESFVAGTPKSFKIELDPDGGNGNTNNEFQIRYYNIKVTNNDALSTKDFIVNNGIKMYPNPAADSFELSSKVDVKSVEIFNVTGQLVKTIESVTNKYDISDLKSGLYLATINTDSGSGTIKLVKE